MIPIFIEDIFQQLMCAAEGLAVGSSSTSCLDHAPYPSPSSSSCLWVCCSDGLRGQVSLLNLTSSSLPQILANITVSDTPITCIAAIPATPTSQATPPNGHVLLPNISVNSISSSSSSDHVTISPTSSFDKDDDLMFIDGDLELSTNSMSTANSKSQLMDSLTVGNIHRVRSNSAPPIPPEDVGGLDGHTHHHHTHHHHHHRVPSPATGQQSLSAQSSINDSTEGGGGASSSSRKVWSALTLRPPVQEGGGGGGVAESDRGDCMWLGTEGGQLHVYRVGDNLRCRTQRRTVDLGAAVCCIR